MTRKMLSEVLLLSAMLQQTSAQLLSCSEIDCPLSYGSARCTIDNTTLTQLGVANFSSSLSPDPLTWTVGYAPEAFTNTTDERIYYLSTPRGFDLDTRADVTGCAMFFIGAEGGLSFLKPDGTDQDYGASDGTCADALGSTCVADLTNQGRNLASNSIALGNFQCSDIALAIQTSPPESCTKAGTWGNITAMAITGSGIPSPLHLDSCVPTINATYDVRSIATFPKIGNVVNGYSIDVTPLMTIFVATGNGTDVLASPEVSLDCMKPILDEPANQMVPEGKAASLTVGGSWSSRVAAVVGVLALVILLD